MKSIRAKITVCLILTVLTALIAVGLSSIIPNYKSTIATVDYMMSETAVLAAERVEQELMAYKNVAADTGCIPQLTDPNVSVDVKKSIIDERSAMHNFQRGNIIGADGISIFDGKDYSDREYVQQAMQGNVYVSEPLISKVTGNLSIMVAAPLYAEGIYGSDIVGVVYYVPHETFLNDIVSSIQIGENSRAYMINKAGDTIADITLETITVQNIEAQAQNDPSLKELAKIHEAMRQGQNGFGSYETPEGGMFLAYAPVKDTDGWSIAVSAPQLNYLTSTYIGIAINIGVIIVSTLISVIVALVLAGSISKPMKACANRMKLLVEGDLDAPMPKVKGRDETAMLVKSTASLVEGLRTIINDIDYLLTSLANQNLDIDTQHEEVYVGSFQDILVCVRHMKVQLNAIMGQVNHSAEQVSSASSMLSSSAQTLSQGTIEQASAVEQLASQITEISKEAQNTAENAIEVRDQTHHSGEEVAQCNQQMQKLMEAMEQIQTSSNEIGKILKTIDDIAFQTNILALNAAVEAARAGSAGKGFAVVADEVRTLASKSDEAAKATKELIEGSITAVAEGGQVVAKVTESLDKTSSIAENVTIKVDAVVEAVESQTTAISQVTEGIEQISSVTQSNSATSEQSAATAQELSDQSLLMNRLVRGFQLS